MKVVIPMAGYGTRLRPHTYSRPKPLINVAGQPMLKYLLDSLQPLNIDQYIFIVGYLGDQLQEYITTEYDFDSVFIRQEDLTGQSPAIYLARDYIDGPTIILFADTLFETDVNVIRTTDADGVIFAKEVEDPQRFGVVKTNAEGHIVEFIEKPSSKENRNAVIGLYYVKDGKRLLRAIEQQVATDRQVKGEFYIASAFEIMIEQGAKFRTENVTVWLDTGMLSTVLETNEYLLTHGDRDNSKEIHREGVTIIPPVNIHPDAKLNNSIIGPHTTIGANCEVNDSIIKNSIVDAGAIVQNSMLDKSLIGQNAQVIGRYRALNVGDQSSIAFS
jgi:glucose-1-phosphate thymidylyltransferase